MEYVPTTIIVNSNPLFTDFLYTWLGRLAKPTYPSRDFDDSDRFTAGLWFSSLMSGFSAFGGGADFSIFSALPSLSRSDGSNFVEGASYLPPGVSPLRKASLLLIWKKNSEIFRTCQHRIYHIHIDVMGKWHIFLSQTISEWEGVSITCNMDGSVCHHRFVWNYLTKNVSIIILGYQ